MEGRAFFFFVYMCVCFLGRDKATSKSQDDPVYVMNVFMDNAANWDVIRR